MPALYRRKRKRQRKKKYPRHRGNEGVPVVGGPATITNAPPVIETPPKNWDPHPDKTKEDLTVYHVPEYSWTKDTTAGPLTNILRPYTFGDYYQNSYQQFQEVFPEYKGKISFDDYMKNHYGGHRGPSEAYFKNQQMQDIMPDRRKGYMDWFNSQIREVKTKGVEKAHDFVIPQLIHKDQPWQPSPPKNDGGRSRGKDFNINPERYHWIENQDKWSVDQHRFTRAHGGEEAAKTTVAALIAAYLGGHVLGKGFDILRQPAIKDTLKMLWKDPKTLLTGWGKDPPDIDAWPKVGYANQLPRFWQRANNITVRKKPMSVKSPMPSAYQRIAEDIIEIIPDEASPAKQRRPSRTGGQYAKDLFRATEGIIKAAHKKKPKK